MPYKRVLEGTGKVVPLRSSILSGPGFWILSVQAFFISMLVLPTSFQAPRGAVLLMLAATAIPVALHRWRVHREILLLWFATMLVGGFGIMWGLIQDAPGALRVSTVYLLWPALFMLFLGLAHGLGVMRRLESALLLGIVIATLTGLVVFLSGLLGLGDVVYPLLAFQDAGFGAYEGFTEFRIASLTTVMYGFPYVVAMLFVRRQKLQAIQRAWLWLLVALMIVVAVGSGRRMFWVLVLLTPFLVLFFLQLSPMRLRAEEILGALSKLSVVGGLAGVGVIFAFGLQPMALIENLAGAFLGREYASSVRYEQAAALWRSFESSPFIGVGLGSVSEVIRSYQQPWAYELAPLSVLKSVGVLGTLVYLGAILWIVLKGLSLARNDREFCILFLPQVTALSAFLLMTFTNPYLGKFDYLWVIFLPVALINAHVTRGGGDA